MNWAGGGASIRTRQNENLFFWGKGFFVLPRLISRPQEGSGEECGRDSDWGFSPPNFVFRFAKCAAEKFDREYLISFIYSVMKKRWAFPKWLKGLALRKPMFPNT